MAVRKEIHDLFGEVIPEPLVLLARETNRMLDKAEQSTELAEKMKKERDNAFIALEVANQMRVNAEYLHPRNLGSHYYPGISPDGNRCDFTSDCKYCPCTMGPSTSSSPEGVSASGICPGNPKLRDAYNLLKGE